MKRRMKTLTPIGKDYQIEAITWLDHSGWSNGGWHDKELTIKEITPFEVKTVGFVIAETDLYLNVVGTLTEANTIQGAFCILKTCIINRKKLK